MSFNSGIIALSDLLTYNNALPGSPGFFQFPDTSPPNAAAAIGGGDFEEANDPHWKDPSSAQWNLTVERELTTNTTVRLSYTGQGAYHLPITVDNNQIPASTTPYTVPNNGYSVVVLEYALPELAAVDGVVRHRYAELSVGYSGSHP